MRKINRNKGNVMKITIRNEYGLPVYETSGIDKTEKRKGGTYKDISGNMKVRVTDSMGNEIYHSKDKSKRKNNKKYDNNQYKEGNKRKEQQAAKSIKENVKNAGGNVSGVLRFSIQWNDIDRDMNDLDAHCLEPNRFHINFSAKKSPYTNGALDIDIINPSPNKPAVENIIYPNKESMME